MSNELEMFRTLFTDDKVHLTIGIVQTVSVSVDRAACYVKCQLAFEERVIQAQVAWDSLGNESGFIKLPNVGDAMLIAFADGEADHAFAIARLSSKDNKIPQDAADGNLSVKSDVGKKLKFSSDTELDETAPKIVREALTSIQDTSLAIKFNAANQPFVLGTVLQTLLNDFVTAIDSTIDALNTFITGVSTGPIGVDANTSATVTTSPTIVGLATTAIASLTTVKTTLATQKTQLLDTPTTNILSQTIMGSRMKDA